MQRRKVNYGISTNTGGNGGDRSELGVMAPSFWLLLFPCMIIGSGLADMSIFMWGFLIFKLSGNNSYQWLNKTYLQIFEQMEAEWATSAASQADSGVDFVIRPSLTLALPSQSTLFFIHKRGLEIKPVSLEEKLSYDNSSLAQRLP